MKLQKAPRRELIIIIAVTLLGVAVRLVEIRQPFVDAWSWRQADVAMIAENFYLNGFNIFYPQINWAGPSPGYVGTEFQIVAFIAALFYPIFGVQEWIGRSVAVFFFAASVPFFYLLVRNVSNERIALFAVGFYTLAPLSIFASRSFMPDMASLSCSVIAVYLFRRWLDRQQDLPLFAGLCLSTALAVLIKLPAATVGLPLLHMSWRKYGGQLLFQRKLWLYAILSLIPPAVWYVYAYYLSATHFPYHMFGSGLLGVTDSTKYGQIFLTTAISHLTPVVSLLMTAGIILTIRTQFGLCFQSWLLAIIMFIFCVGEGHFRHGWYQLPLVPVAAAFAGYTCDFGLRRFTRAADSKVALVSVCLILFSAVAYGSYIYTQPFYKAVGIASFNGGSELAHIAPPDALVITADNGDPTTLYYSRRRGWHFPQGSMLSLPWPTDARQVIGELETLRDEGGSYLVLTKPTFYLLSGKYVDFRKYLVSQYRRVRQTDEYIIFDLAPGRESVNRCAPTGARFVAILSGPTEENHRNPNRDCSRGHR